MNPGRKLLIRLCEAFKAVGAKGLGNPVAFAIVQTLKVAGLPRLLPPSGKHLAMMRMAVHGPLAVSGRIGNFQCLVRYLCHGACARNPLSAETKSPMR